MSFKEEIQKDINTFINLDEFGESHEVDGVLLDIIIDEDLYKKNSLSNGIFEETITFHVKSSDLQGKPRIKQIMKFDSKNYRVKDYNENDGISTILLTANMS